MAGYNEDTKMTIVQNEMVETSSSEDNERRFSRRTESRNREDLSLQNQSQHTSRNHNDNRTVKRCYTTASS